MVNLKQQAQKSRACKKFAARLLVLFGLKSFAEFLQISTGHGFSKKITLQDIAAQSCANICVILTLDPFGNHRQIERTPDLHNGFHKAFLNGTVNDIHDQLTVNF